MKKLNCVTLVICLLLSLAPISVFSQQDEELSNLPNLAPSEVQEVVGNNNELLNVNSKIVAKKVREVKEKRTSNSKHYLLEDGSYVAEISLDNIHYETGSGEFEEINTSLVDEADLGNVDVSPSKEVAVEVKNLTNEIKEKKIKKDKSVSDFRALQVPFDVKIPKKFNKGYSIGKGSDKLSFKPIGASSSNAVLDPDHKSRVRYENAWEQADVILDVTGSGLKETIILKTDLAPQAYSFEVTGGLTNELTAGSLSLEPAWLVDAEGELRDVVQTVRRDANKVYVDLVADTTGLNYPIEIDPTITVNTGVTHAKILIDHSSSNAVFPPVGSPFVQMNNFIDIIKQYEWNSIYWRSVQSYGVVGFNTAAIPDEFVVSSATLSIYISTVVNNNNFDLIADYVNGQPINEAMYSDAQIINDAFSSPLPLSSLPNKGYVHINLKNLSNINKTGFSQIRMGLSSKATPFGHNAVRAYDPSRGSAYTPYITVIYNTPPTAPIVTSPNGGEIWNNEHTITWTAATDPNFPQASLQYQIQLSANGGYSWTDIVPLTAAGVTFYTHNFNLYADSTNHLLRIRAYNGGIHGPWDQSNAPFTIKHNTAPNPPTNTSPGGTTSALAVMSGTLTPTLTWTFSDPDVGNTQSALKVMIYRTTDNVLISDSNWVNSSLGSYTIPTGLLARGTAYYWKVQAKDNVGAVSPLSANKYIEMNRLPTLGITSYADNQSIPDNLLTFTWAYSDLDSNLQTKYQVQGSTDNWATVAYNSGEITSSSTIHTSTFAQGEWDFRIRALDGYEWSDWVYRNNLLLPSSFEPNDTSATAFNILHDQNYTTLISSITDVDFYKFTSNQTGIDRVTLNVPTGKNYDLYIYDSNMNLIAAGPKLSGNEDVLVFVQSGQVYYVKVFGINTDNSPNPYTLRVVKFGNTNGIFHTDYQYDSNGNLTNKQTTTE